MGNFEFLVGGAFVGIGDLLSSFPGVPWLFVQNREAGQWESLWSVKQFSTRRQGVCGQIEQSRIGTMENV